MTCPACHHVWNEVRPTPPCVLCAHCSMRDGHPDMGLNLDRQTWLCTNRVHPVTGKPRDCGNLRKGDHEDCAFFSAKAEREETCASGNEEDER
jgi:hypothetical protein